MTKTVVLVGTLDTKGEEFALVKRMIENNGLRTLMVDFGIMGAPAFEPDVSRSAVIAAGGGDLSYLASGSHKDRAMKAAKAGLVAIVQSLFDEGKLDGILSMGGTGGTSVATAAMRGLPVGVPKVMVSTVGGGDVRAYAGAKDIIFVPSIVDVAGINRISREIYSNAAGAISGMVNAPRLDYAGDKPLIAASMFGNTTAAVDHARKVVEKQGYETLVFHCTGTGGRTMESLITDRLVSGVLDVTTTELADYVCGGIFDAGKDRCTAAPATGTPAVVAPGCVDMANFAGLPSVPKKYRNRLLYEWNADTTLLRTNVEENIRIGTMIANAANASSGPTAVFLPLRGVSMLDSEGGEFWNPEADSACFMAIKNNIRSDIPVFELDHNINDTQFSGRMAEVLLEMLELSVSHSKDVS